MLLFLTGQGLDYLLPVGMAPEDLGQLGEDTCINPVGFREVPGLGEITCLARINDGDMKPACKAFATRSRRWPP